MPLLALMGGQSLPALREPCDLKSSRPVVAAVNQGLLVLRTPGHFHGCRLTILGASLPGAWTIPSHTPAPFHSEPVLVWVINDTTTPLQQTWKGGRSVTAPT